MTKRLAAAQAIRIAALDLVTREGIDRITSGPSRDGSRIRIAARSVKDSDFEISYAKLGYAGDLLDIWTDRKVFSVWCGPDGTLDIVSFRRGDWESRLAEEAQHLAKGRARS